IRGTLMLDQFMAQTQAQSAQRESAAASAAKAAQPNTTRGTLMLDSFSPGAVSDASATASLASYRPETDVPTNREPVLVAPHYSAVCLQQLQYLGELLRRARQPVCPMNGLLMLIQFESIHSTPAEMDDLQKAFRADLSTIQFATQLRAPVTA